ncbi:hypothetical protein [Paraburkholderia ultramafica]|uniref:hypothetical protein n=1 Tax=Paraburkholderia ultramafica TaxID=1544867 RepID=UPI001FE5B90D|nr:hypothetical protein [Paraburkholderia ultramafica]
MPLHLFRKTPVAPERPPGAKSRPRRKRRQETQTRRVGLQRLAFFRGYLEGLELSGLADLDGSRGANRNVITNNSGAKNDMQAIEFWLTDYENRDAREKYRAEAGQLLLWANFAKGKPQPSLDVNDAREHVNRFLVDPQPAVDWVNRNPAPRHDLAWRPFRRPTFGQEPAGRARGPENVFWGSRRCAVHRPQRFREDQGVPRERNR